MFLGGGAAHAGNCAYQYRDHLFKGVVVIVDYNNLVGWEQSAQDVRVKLPVVSRG